MIAVECSWNWSVLTGRFNLFKLPEARMSYLQTTWCSQASLTQRRGRTGRTNPGKYFCFVSKDLYQELQEFDKSGVERSALTKVALQAAHLADQLSIKTVRAGLPVRRRSAEPRTAQPGRRQDVVSYFDGERGLWRVSGECGEIYWASDEELELLQLKVANIINLLPSPPGDLRLNYATEELQDLGLLTLAGQRPTTLGASCLKLPVDVPLARLVVLGWALDLGVHAAILASALSLPSCDIMYTPHNHVTELSEWDLKSLKASVDARQRLDEGRLSEPLIMHSLCCAWLLEGNCSLGRLPDVFRRQGEEDLQMNSRLWSQFTTKLADLLKSMLRLARTNSGETHRTCAKIALRAHADSLSGFGRHAPRRFLPKGDRQMDDFRLVHEVAASGAAPNRELQEVPLPKMQTCLIHFAI